MSQQEARPYIGGQAVIEGVMMRSPRSLSIVVRRRSGKLVVRERAVVDVRKGVLAWPFVRGVVTLFEAIKLGAEALRFSAELYEQDLEEEEKAKQESEKAKPGVLSALALSIAALATQGPEPRLPTVEEGASEKKDAGRGLMNVLSIALALGLFVALPQLFAALAN